MLKVVTLNVVMLSAILLSVIAPFLTGASVAILFSSSLLLHENKLECFYVATYHNGNTYHNQKYWNRLPGA